MNRFLINRKKILNRKKIIKRKQQQQKQQQQKQQQQQQQQKQQQQKQQQQKQLLKRKINSIHKKKIKYSMNKIHKNQQMESVYECIINSYYLDFNNLNILECGSSNLGLDTKDFRHSNNCYYIEPLPNSFKFLIKNAKNIKIENVYNLAISDVSGKLDFHVSSLLGNSSLCHSNDHINELINIHNSTFKTIQVDSVTYKYFIENIINKTIDILILDVEGAEIRILESFKSLTTSQMPKIICIECGYDWNERKQLLLELGYTLDFYSGNNCYASIGPISKNLDVIKFINNRNVSFIWHGKQIYHNDLI